VPLVALLAEGELVAVPNRSGGAFDPVGCRGQDITRADDVVALVEAHAGRWLLVTLTVDRERWTGPGAAYQRCNERVREVARVVSKEGIHVTAFELQGKSGAGWPHWHLIVFAPDDRPISEIRRRVEKAWSIIERREEVDQETGEVLWETRSRESIGIVDVQEARTVQGVARYAAKYLVKAWPAVPSWMGESRRQLRKLRCSVKCFAWWECAGRHHRATGSRRKRTAGRRRRTRSLFDRMASSGLSMRVMQRTGDRLTFVRAVQVPAGPEFDRRTEELGGSAICKEGVPWERMRWRLSRRAFAAMTGEDAGRWEQLAEVCRSVRRAMLEEAWDRMQEPD
jgi:hypothetical protein